MSTRTHGICTQWHEKGINTDRLTHSDVGNFQIMMLSERSQTQRLHVIWALWVEISRTGTNAATDRQSICSCLGLWGGYGDYLQMNTGNFWGAGSALNWIGVMGPQLYRFPSNCTLKMCAFMVCDVYLNKSTKISEDKIYSHGPYFKKYKNEYSEEKWL